MHARLHVNRLNATDSFQLQSVATTHAHGWAAEDVLPPAKKGKENQEKRQLLPDMGPNPSMVNASHGTNSRFKNSDRSLGSLLAYLRPFLDFSVCPNSRPSFEKRRAGILKVIRSALEGLPAVQKSALTRS